MFPTPYAHHPIHLSVQFLDTVLSQRGPDAVPYSEDVKWFVRQHVLALVQEFPSLQMKTAVFTHNDGRMANLLLADGTIPILFRHVSYNIPVVIWLTEPYPRQPPVAFVNPTHDMVVKPGHPLVDPSGVVSVPYLGGWVFPTSNLVDLVRNMSHLFGFDPPLYTKNPSAKVPSSSRASHSSSFPSPTLVGRTSPPDRPSPPPSSVSSSASDYPPPSSRPTAHPPLSPFTALQVPPPRVDASDEDAASKRKLIDELVWRLHSDSLALRNSREDQLDALFKAQAALRRRQRELEEGLTGLMAEKERLEELLQMVLTNTDVLETWVTKEITEKQLQEIEVDDALEPLDVLSKQMLECTAADLVIEDSIHALDNAMRDGVVSFDVYMRNQRALAREQFFHRAMSAKVRAAHMQAQITNMASRSAASRV